MMIDDDDDDDDDRTSALTQNRHGLIRYNFFDLNLLTSTHKFDSRSSNPKFDLPNFDF
jgi:hypothetical protein